MKKLHYSLFITILICFASCNLTKKEKKDETKINEAILEKKIEKVFEEKGIENYQFIENDSIAYLWESELKSLAKNFKGFKIKTELKQNDHYEAQIDTIKTLTFEKSVIEVYSTDGFYAIWSADIQNSELPVWSYVKIGMKKYQLEKTLANRIEFDTIRLGNLEQTSVFEFYFTNDKLKRIKFEGYID